LPTPTPAYDLRLEADAVLVPGAAGGDWLVVGLALAGDEAVRSPHLVISLKDATGAEISRRSVEIPPDPLPPGAAWPFLESFRPPAPPSTVDATLLGLAVSGQAAARINGEVLRIFLDAQGGSVALGSLTNGATGPVLIEHVRLLGKDTAGAMQAVLDVTPARRELAAGEVTAFLADLPPRSEPLEWEVHAIAAAVDGPAQAIEILDVYATEDDQANPFVTAVLRNDSEDARWVTLTAVARRGEVWLSGDSFSLPVPLAPGERAPVALRVAGAGLPDDEQVEWLLIPDSTMAESGSVPVASEVVAFSPVGSTLFLRVRLTGGDAPAVKPAAYASIATDDGRTVSAAWAAGPATLTPGQTSVVTLALPVPGGFELTQGQVDVRAAGIP
jgi:hypothetical protein